jgi:hypothetical protein
MAAEPQAIAFHGRGLTAHSLLQPLQKYLRRTYEKPKSSVVLGGFALAVFACSQAFAEGHVATEVPYSAFEVEEPLTPAELVDCKKPTLNQFVGRKSQIRNIKFNFPLLNGNVLKPDVRKELIATVNTMRQAEKSLGVSCAKDAQRSGELIIPSMNTYIVGSDITSAQEGCRIFNRVEIFPTEMQSNEIGVAFYSYETEREVVGTGKNILGMTVPVAQYTNVVSNVVKEKALCEHTKQGALGMDDVFTCSTGSGLIKFDLAVTDWSMPVDPKCKK